MKPQELAEKLAGATYRNVISKELAAEAKAHGLVVVYGQSDDLTEFAGAIDDEIGFYPGRSILLDAKGLLRDRSSIEDDDELRDYFAREPNAKTVVAMWASEGAYSWTFKTGIPHATFEITEDGKPYCRGIVFALASAGGASEGATA